MNNGTKERTALRVLTSAGVAVAVWQTVFAGVLSMLGEVWVAAIVATVVSLFVLGVDAVTTYFNNDYTQEGAIGTSVTRDLKDDPTIIVDIIDGDEDDEDDEEDDADAEAEGGDPDEVE